MLWPVDPPISITPLLVGEVTNVLPYTQESNGRLGPANYNNCSISYQYHIIMLGRNFLFLLTRFPFIGGQRCVQNLRM